MDFQGGLIFEGTSGVFHGRSGDIFLAIFFFCSYCLGVRGRCLLVFVSSC
jgi:hypothetical protein